MTEGIADHGKARAPEGIGRPHLAATPLTAWRAGKISSTSVAGSEFERDRHGDRLAGHRAAHLAEFGRRRRTSITVPPLIESSQCMMRSPSTEGISARCTARTPRYEEPMAPAAGDTVKIGGDRRAGIHALHLVITGPMIPKILFH